MTVPPAPQQIPARPAEAPIFQIKATKHTGAMILWHSRSVTVNAPYDHCMQELSDAQTWCTLMGWWSPVSLVMNPITMAGNTRQRKELHRQAGEAQAYSQWWVDNYGQHDPSVRVWVAPEYRPPRRWWLWIPIGVFCLIAMLMLVVIVLGVIKVATDKGSDTKSSYESMPAPVAQVWDVPAPEPPTVIRLG